MRSVYVKKVRDLIEEKKIKNLCKNMINKRIILLVLLTGVFAIALTSTATAAIWTKTTVDTKLYSGMDNAIAVDSKSNVHISYTHEGDVVRYAKKTGNKWAVETVGMGASGGDNALALDSNDNPQIVYSYAPITGQDGVIIYARKINGKWVTSKTFAGGQGGGKGCALALDSNNNPHIIYSAFLGNFNFDLHYAKKVGGIWTTESLGVNRPVAPSIVVDKKGNPHIAYNDLSGYIMYGTKINGKWNFAKVDETGMYMRPSLALDSYGNPHLSYYKTGTGFLRYAKKVNGIWTATNVEKTGQYPLPSLAIDKNGIPNIIYKNNDGTLRYAKKNSTWTIESVDNTHVSGGFNSLALDKYGNLHAAYFANVIRYAFKDITPPKISSTTPSNFKTGVNRWSTTLIKFNENIKASSYYNKITIRNLSTGKYMTLTKIISGNTLYIKTAARNNTHGTK